MLRQKDAIHLSVIELSYFQPILCASCKTDPDHQPGSSAGTDAAADPKQSVVVKAKALKGDAACCGVKMEII